MVMGSLSLGLSARRPWRLSSVLTTPGWRAYVVTPLP